MTLLVPLIYPDDRLKTVATPVKVFDDKLNCLVDNMLETMYHHQGCGLAATQVNHHQRLVVIDCSEEMNNPIVLVNPEITHLSGDMPWNEACISFPGVYAQTTFAKNVVVQYQDLTGSPQTIQASDDLLCACLQHEIRHLDGKLLIDQLSTLKADRLKKKYFKRLKQAQNLDKETVADE